GEAFMRYHDYHRLIYDGSPLQIQGQGDHLSIAWGEVPFKMSTQLTDEIAIALMIEFIKSNILDNNHLHLHEVHFQHPTPNNIARYVLDMRCKVLLDSAKAEVLMAVSEVDGR